MSKVLAVIFAFLVVAGSVTIVMSISPVVDLLSWYEKDYEETKEYYDAITLEKIPYALDKADAEQLDRLVLKLKK